MHKFIFKYAVVLKARRARQEEALRQFGIEQRAFKTEIDKEAKLKEELGQALQRREGLGIEPVSIIAFQSEQDHITGVKQRLIRMDQSIRNASRRVEKALRAYLFAKKQTRIVEVLYDRAYLEYRKERSKREQKMQDDLVVMRYHLKETVS